MKRLKNVVVVAALVCCAVGMEVTELKWDGQHTYAVLQENTPMQKMLTCKYKLDKGDRDAAITFIKDGISIKSFKAPTQIVPTQVYSQEFKFMVTRRKDGGKVTCKVSNKKTGVKSERSTQLHVVQVALTDTDNYHNSLTQNNCVAQYSEQTPWSDPPIQSKCGIWQSSKPSDKMAGSWVPSTPRVKTMYSSEKSDYEVEKYIKSGHVLSKTRRHILNASFKLRELPKDKFMDIRCHHYYKFGSGNTAVRIDRDIFVDRLMVDNKYRCPVVANQTVEGGKIRVVGVFNNSGPSDCMDMWSASTPIKGKLSCIANNSTRAVELTCRDFHWRRGSGSAKFDAKRWSDNCLSAGATLVLNIGLLFLGVAASTAFSKN